MDLAQARRFSSGTDGKPDGFQASCHGKALHCLGMLRNGLTRKRRFALRHAVIASRCHALREAGLGAVQKRLNRASS